MSVAATCAVCQRELLLDQLVEPWAGFRCPFCGQAFAPSYGTVAPGVAARVIAAHGALVSSLTELQSMIDGRLRLDRARLLGPVADTLPVEASSA